MSKLYMNDPYSLTEDMRKLVLIALASGFTEDDLEDMLDDVLDHVTAEERVQDEY